MQATANKTSSFRQAAVFIGLALALVLAIGWSASVGQFGATIGESLNSMMRLVFNTGLGDAPEPVDTALWRVRLPRIALACPVGAGLALAGVALQAVFGNPLVEPSLIGASFGAAVGATTAIVLGIAAGLSGVLGGVLSAFASSWVIVVSAFIGGAVATAIVAANAHSGRDIARIIPVGVVMNSICGGLVSLLTFVASTAAHDRIMFWQTGSLASATRTQVVIVMLVTVPAVIAMWVSYRKPDIPSLGEVQACHLGINVTMLRRAIIFGMSLVVAAGVVFSGIIAFTGLVVPHAARPLLGPAHCTLIPACTLGGALATTLADPAARTMIVGAGLSLGILISTVGDPLLFWLLLRSKKVVY